MVNAKKGTILSMDELLFPPRSLAAIRSMRTMTVIEQVEEEDVPEFTYVPVAEEVVEEPPRDTKYYLTQNIKHIRKLEERNRERRKGLVEATADGETEIWSADYAKTLDDKGWAVEKPEPYMPLAQAVDLPAYTKMMRQEDGSEVRGGRRYTCYKSSQTFLAPIEQLKAGKNNDSWADGDKALATADTRWLKNSRGPIHTDYNPDVRARDDFITRYKPIGIEEQWRPPFLPGQEPTHFVTKGLEHNQLFSSVITPAKKGETIVRGQREEPSLLIQEAWHEKRVNMKDDFKPKKGHRWQTIFPDKLQLGATDSMFVKKLPPTFPSVNPGF